jgi:hypothetical protein
MESEGTTVPIVIGFRPEAKRLVELATGEPFNPDAARRFIRRAVELRLDFIDANTRGLARDIMAAPGGDDAMTRLDTVSIPATTSGIAAAVQWASRPENAGATIDQFAEKARRFSAADPITDPPVISLGQGDFRRDYRDVEIGAVNPLTWLAFIGAAAGIVGLIVWMAIR